MLPQHRVQVTTLTQLKNRRKRRAVHLENVQQPDNVRVPQGAVDRILAHGVPNIRLLPWLRPALIELVHFDGDPPHAPGVVGAKDLAKPAFSEERGEGVAAAEQ